ncbi:patatin-like phospholipase family protein [Echinicola sp. 20G]|uniref:patatin-like phospholipase family protein n=1 Tax=Echinicola sp. 20G TaxID=2781961 RepID=UPI0019106CFE|nr:patatin-like phospholipase family protein [Echinicola sp. 20G]
MFTRPGSNSGIKRSLVLAGGGMRVAYQSGVIMALEEAGLEFFHVDGTSGGIFNTGMLASGLQPKSMAENWRTLKLTHFISGRKAKNYLKPLKMQGYADADNIRNKIFPHLGIDIRQIQSGAHANATFNVCNFSQKSIEAIPCAHAKENHLIAGVSLPIFMPALKIDNNWYSDAVWIKDANLMEAVKQGAEEIWLVWAIGNAPTYLSGAFYQYVHMIEMSANGGLLEEYKQIKMFDQLHPDRKATKLFVIKSPIPLPLDPDFFFNKVNARELINMGYKHAKEYLLNKNDNGENLDHTATSCLEPSKTLSFRGVYEGGLTLGTDKVPVQYFVYHRYSKFRDRQEIVESSSSIAIEGHLKETALFDHQISIEKENNIPYQVIKGSFLKNGETHTLTTKQKLSGPWEIIFGLGFKSISIQIIDQEGKVALEGTLYQSLSNRLKSWYFTSLTTVSGSGTGIKGKLNMFKDFVAYGI